jgi:hypothetical protein
MAGNFATTTLHTSQTENANNRHGIEIQRFLLATFLPEACQNLGLSGCQSVKRCALRTVVACPEVIVFISL